MSRGKAEVLSHCRQVIIVKTIFFVILILICVECSDNKLNIEKRDVHRIIIIPERNGNAKKRPTKGSTYTHYFNNIDQQVQPTQFNGPNQISYQNKLKSPSKNRYHEMQLPDRFFKDTFVDGSTIHVFNSKNGWRPIPGNSLKQQQHFLHPSKYNFSPGASTSASTNIFPPQHSSSSSSSTSTSRRPASSQHKTNKKISRNKSRFSTTGDPRHKSLAEMIDLTTAVPQPLPPVQTYLNIMADLHQTADQSQNYLYQNVLVRPGLKKINSASTTSATTRTPKSTKKTRVTTISTTSKPYEVYENIDEDFPSPVKSSGNGPDAKVQYYGKRIKTRRPIRLQTTTKK